METIEAQDKRGQTSSHVPAMKTDADSKPEVSGNAGAVSRAIGHWIHEHKDFTDKNPIGYTGYQYLRSALASVPYGLSMAGTYLGFEHLAKYGEKLAGNSMDKLSVPPGGAKANFGYRLAQFTRSPAVLASAMIGTSFSLYRGTSKIAKWVNESLFNPEDTEAQTVEKVHNLPKAIWGKIGEVAPAEINSTPVSAIVLGFLVSSFKAPKALDVAISANKAMKGQGFAKRFDHFWKEIVRNPETRFVEQSAINTIAYSLFFELGDRRFKDKQVSRGLWSGNPHSIGSGNKSNPSLVENPLAAKDLVPDPDQEIAVHSRVNDKLAFLTSEPSVPRFFLRRVLPTAVGITAYTAFKFRGAPLVLGKFSEGLKTVKDIPTHAWREGAATSLFFMIPLVTDKYAKWYDNFVNGLEEMVSGKRTPQAPEVDEKHMEKMKHNFQELREKIDEKERKSSPAIS